MARKITDIVRDGLEMSIYEELDYLLVNKKPGDKFHLKEFSEAVLVRFNADYSYPLNDASLIAAYIERWGLFEIYDLTKGKLAKYWAEIKGTVGSVKPANQRQKKLGVKLGAKTATKQQKELGGVMCARCGKILRRDMEDTP